MALVSNRIYVKNDNETDKINIIKFIGARGAKDTCNDFFLNNLLLFWKE